MSIIVTLTVPDGVIVGADSAAVLPGSRALASTIELPETLAEWARAPVMKSFGGQRKLFELGDRPIGIACYGTPMIADRWLGSYIYEFIGHDVDGVVSGNTTVEQIAESLGKFFANLYETVTKAFLTDFRKMPYDQIPKSELPGYGFVVAGYSAKSHYPEVWHVFVPTGPKPQLMRKQRDLSLNWFGIYEPLERYFKGYSDSLLKSLLERFEKLRGIPLSEDEKKELSSSLASYEYPTTASLMPISVGIEYVRFLLEIVTKHYHFAVGVAAVAGPLNIGYATYAKPKFELIHLEN